MVMMQVNAGFLGGGMRGELGISDFGFRISDLPARGAFGFLEACYWRPAGAVKHRRQRGVHWLLLRTSLEPRPLPSAVDPRLGGRVSEFGLRHQPFEFLRRQSFFRLHSVFGFFRHDFYEVPGF